MAMRRAMQTKEQKELFRKKAVARLYNISTTQYDLLVEKAEYKCEICGTYLINRKPYIDHDHETSMIRGVLCNSCNTGVGCFKDSINHLKKAIAYLERADVRWQEKSNKCL
jgi:hypothetical protein